MLTVHNTRSKLMKILFHLVMTIFKFLNFDAFLKRRTNLKSMFYASSEWRDFRLYAKLRENYVWISAVSFAYIAV